MGDKNWGIRKGDYFLYNPSHFYHDAPDFVPLKEDHVSAYSFTKWYGNLTELSQETWAKAKAGSVLYEHNAQTDGGWPRGYYKCTVISK